DRLGVVPHGGLAHAAALAVALGIHGGGAAGLAGGGGERVAARFAEGVARGHGGLAQRARHSHVRGRTVLARSTRACRSSREDAAPASSRYSDSSRLRIPRSWKGVPPMVRPGGGWLPRSQVRAARRISAVSLRWRRGSRSGSWSSRADAATSSAGSSEAGALRAAAATSASWAATRWLEEDGTSSSTASRPALASPKAALT